MRQKFEDDIKRPGPSLEDTLTALKTYEEGMPGAVIVYGLSNLSDDDLERLKPMWELILPETRARILNTLVDVSEANFELDYRAIGLFSLNDNDALVRKAAIEVLWEDESFELMNKLVNMAQWDESAMVRAAAASALGRFILLGELGDLPEDKVIPAQDAVVNLWIDSNEEVEVRRRALEAVANCGHEIVRDAIEEAYQSHEQLMRVSAIFAMGRTYDERWNDVILREMDNPVPEIRYEAARASGELEITEAIPRLARLAANDDREVKEAAIWSLGEIGGREAMRVLDRLAEDADNAEDDALLEAIEDAIANASLVSGDLAFGFDRNYDD
jgi:HEAT repeat protein